MPFQPHDVSTTASITIAVARFASRPIPKRLVFIVITVLPLQLAAAALEARAPVPVRRAEVRWRPTDPRQSRPAQAREAVPAAGTTAAAAECPRCMRSAGRTGVAHRRSAAQAESERRAHP